MRTACVCSHQRQVYNFWPVVRGRGRGGDRLAQFALRRTDAPAPSGIRSHKQYGQDHPHLHSHPQLARTQPRHAAAPLDEVDAYRACRRSAIALRCASDVDAALHLCVKGGAPPFQSRWLLRATMASSVLDLDTRLSHQARHRCDHTYT